MRRLRGADRLAGLAALALAGALFAPWFGAASGWSSLGWLALSLVLAALLAALAVPALTATRASPTGPLAAATAAMLLGALATIALLVQVVAQPGHDEAVAVRYGWWLGLGATVALTGAAFASLRDERVLGRPDVPVEVRPVPSIDPR